MRVIHTLIVSTFAWGAATTQAAVDSSDLGPVLELDLPGAIALALTANRDIQSAYLGRISEEYSLRVAEDRFRPDLDLIADGEIGQSGDRSNPFDTEVAALSQRLSLLAPTGGAVSLTWANRRESTPSGAATYEAGLELSVVQPLLRGGGFAVNRAPVRIARINERINVLTLRSTINRIITDVVTGYRQLMLEERRLDIAERSLIRARRLLETNRALIDAGRMARQDIVQTEADASQRELDLVSAQNTADSARLALLDTLDIDPETRLKLTKTLRLEEAGGLDFETAYARALASRPTYLQALLRLEIARIDTRTARNERLWRLDASVTASVAGFSDEGPGAALEDWNDDPVQYRAGLQLTVPIGDRSRKRGVIDAEVARRRLELSAQEVREAVRIDIKDRVRTIESLRRQVDLAQRAAELAARQLEIENLKLSQGRSSNFQVLDFENQLITAQINEATAEVSYLNARTQLDEALGTSMETWRIPFEVRRYENHDLILTGDPVREVQR